MTARRALRTAALLAAIACAALPPASRAAAPADDPVLRAMSDELTRSMKQLVLPGAPAPYFLGYGVQEEQALTLDARYTGLVDSERTEDRHLTIDLRVGSPAQDNTNYYEGWESFWIPPADLVAENDYDAIRHQIWYRTDTAYKDALENLARKQAFLQTHPEKKAVPDFSPADPFVALEEHRDLTPHAGELRERVSRASRVFLDFPFLEDWQVSLRAQVANKWYVNSEGSRFRKGRGGEILQVSATAQADDGQRLTGFLEFIARDPDPLPEVAALADEVRRMAADMQAAVHAPAEDEYAGPILFTDFAAAQYVSQLVAAQLSPPRKPLTSEDWLAHQLAPGKLATKLKRRVLPAFVSIQDRPTLESWEGKRLLGFQKVDDEGVPCRDITLVDAGRLVDLPMGRQPTEDIARSNGHARSLTMGIEAPAVTNLIVSSSQPLSEEKLVEELKRLAAEQGLAYGLLVKRLEEPRFSDAYRWIDSGQEAEEALLSAPLFAYKVYVKDGRIEPVRGLEFEDVTIRSLRDIDAMGKDAKAYNLEQTGSLPNFVYPASIVTPSILVEEMECKAAAVREPLPHTKNPIFP